MLKSEKVYEYKPERITAAKKKLFVGTLLYKLTEKKKKMPSN